MASGDLQPDEVDEAAIARRLYLADLPDPDLMIRTSGEYRLSNFLLWQAAYAEFEFVDECWPDFTPEMLAGLIAGFGTRERRFGAVSAG